jgi:hypothetical protein
MGNLVLGKAGLKEAIAPYFGMGMVGFPSRL